MGGEVGVWPKCVCVVKVCGQSVCMCVWPKCMWVLNGWVVKWVGGQVGRGSSGCVAQVCLYVVKVWPMCVWPKCVQGSSVCRGQVGGWLSGWVVKVGGSTSHIDGLGPQIVNILIFWL